MPEVNDKLSLGVRTAWYWTAEDRVGEAVDEAVDEAVHWTVYWTVRLAVRDAVHWGLGSVQQDVYRGVRDAVFQDPLRSPTD